MSLTMTVDTSGRFPKLDWPAAAGLWTTRAAPLGQQILRARAPFRTGALRESIDDERTVSPGLATVIFYSQVDYVKWVLSGTKPHVITARNAKALRWTGRGGIGVNFARSVNHPGTKPNDFPVEAIGAIGPAVAAMFSAAVQETMKL